MRNHPDKREFDVMEQRYQVAKMARLRDSQPSEKVTAVEVIGVFAALIFLTIVLPTIASLVVGR